MKILVFSSDLSGCYTYRVKNPLNELKTLGVEWQALTYIPNMPGEAQINTLVNVIKDYDMVLIQRCYLYSIVKTVRDACSFMGVPLVFETDDDYLHLPPDNPAYASIIHPSILKQLVGPDLKLLPGVTPEMFYAHREQALDEYRQILQMMDAITVSTEELRQTILPYNRNVKVLPNCVPNVYPWRTWDSEESMTNANGDVVPTFNQGMVTVPGYRVGRDGRLLSSPRIGYTMSPSHRGRDWETIGEYWDRLIKKYSNKSWWFIYIGADPGEYGNFIGDRANGVPPKDYWIARHLNVVLGDKVPWRAVPIAPADYDLYMYHLRNVDVGVSALHGDGTFNFCKSPIKGQEMAAHGNPSVLPNFITYSRVFTHGEDALLYNNGREFMEYVELLANDSKLRSEMGLKALNLIKDNWLEKHWAEIRKSFYESVIDGGYRLQIFTPEKVHANNIS